MAKQSGLHQIKGKVGEHSYYQQTGVSGGLVRRINQGMSEKVKKDEAFANTRLNNAEFGQATRIASCLGMYINPKYRPMILPFSQSKMSQSILDTIKTDSASWGKRNLTIDDAPAVVAALNRVSKNNADVWGISINYGEDRDELVANNDIWENQRESINADGCMVSFISASLEVGKFSDAIGKYYNSLPLGQLVSSDVDDDVLQLSAANIPVPLPGNETIRILFYVVIILPYRTINNNKHILQEHCTFKAFVQPQAPE